ncbi:MAG: response regulator [Deinococcus-Thermus bacterium]|jgi:DNA-binding NarL/FixJ family response regulator|nr:response regulator [Deinococcota bacterium]
MDDGAGPIRVLLVDDHTVVRQGLRMVMSLEDDLDVVGEAANGREAVEAVARDAPDVVLMDLLMPVMNGVEAIRTIKAAHPEIEAVALTSVLEDRLVIDAVEAGAAGYLLKETGPDALFEAIRAAARGEVRLDPRAQKRLVREVRTPEMRESLTPRETDTLRLIAKGLANKDIAHELGVSEVTVKTHVSNVLSKLGLQSRTQAALFALKEGLTGLD